MRDRVRPLDQSHLSSSSKIQKGLKNKLFRVRTRGAQDAAEGPGIIISEGLLLDLQSALRWQILGAPSARLCAVEGPEATERSYFAFQRSAVSSAELGLRGSGCEGTAGHDQPKLLHERQTGPDPEAARLAAEEART